MGSRLCSCFVSKSNNNISGRKIEFYGIGDGENLRRAEVLFNDDVHASKHFGHEEVIAGLVEGGIFGFVPTSLARETEP